MSNGIDGVYAFVYGSYIGLGFGVFRIADGELVGADFGGATYRGRVVEDAATREIDMSFEMHVPAGVPLVQGTSAQDLPYTKIVAGRVPPAFGDGEPFKLEVPPGVITLMVRRIPDELSALADGMVVDIRPMPPKSP
jgi:hypothetical protein